MVGFSGLGAAAVASVLLASLAEVPGSQGVRAGSTDSPPRGHCWRAELAAGYGHGVDLSSDRGLGDARYVGFFPRTGRSLLGHRRARTCHDRGFRVLAEVPVLLAIEPRRGYAVGLSLLGRYAFPSSRRLRPFVDVGAGPIYLGFDHPEQPDGLSFTLQAGAGVQVLVSPDWYVLSGLRLHHLSNGGLRDPNPGLNAVLLTVGVGRVLGRPPPIP